jgi:CRP/FNR family transcriptional regulator
MEQISELINDLRTLPCLAYLRKEELSLIGEQTQIRRFQKNDIIFKESDRVNFFFIVRTGRIKLFKTSSEGKELIINIIEQNNHFCCAPLYTGERHFVNAVALEDSTLILIPTQDFKAMLSSSIDEMGLRIITGLCSRIKHLSNLVGDLTFKDVEERVMISLLRLAVEKSPDERIVPLRVTHHDIASMTGTVREVVSRIMSRLKKEGVITDSGIRGFKVDKDRLADTLNRKYHR